MKKDISANLYQKCLILCSKILLNVLHNTSLIPMATYRVPELPNIKGISGHLERSIFIFANGAWYALSPPGIIQQAYKHLSSSLWPHLTIFELKTLTYWDQVLSLSQRLPMRKFLIFSIILGLGLLARCCFFPHPRPTAKRPLAARKRPLRKGEDQVGKDWKKVSCHGNRTFYSRRCASCLRCKLAKIALFIYLIEKIALSNYDALIGQKSCFYNSMVRQN